MRKPFPLLFANDSACILCNVKMQQHGDNIMPHPRYHTAAAISCSATRNHPAAISRQSRSRRRRARTRCANCSKCNEQHECHTHGLCQQRVSPCSRRLFRHRQLRRVLAHVTVVVDDLLHVTHTCCMACKTRGNALRRRRSPSIWPTATPDGLWESRRDHPSHRTR